MEELNEVINNLQKNDKVMIVYGENQDSFEGFVSGISNKHLTIHEYVPDIYRTFNTQNIIEICKV